MASTVLIAQGQAISLPSFSVSGLPIGTIITTSDAIAWQLSVSAAAVDHTTVEAVSGASGLRWLKYTAGAGGAVASVVAGAGIGVNSADPANPIVSVTGGLVLIETKVIAGSAQTTDLVFNTGIDGNADHFHYFVANVFNDAGGGMEFDIQPNGVSTNILSSIGTLAVGYSNTASQSVIRFVTAAASEACFTTMKIGASTCGGIMPRMFQGEYTRSTTFNERTFVSGRWNEVATNITSYTLKAIVGQFAVGSRISLYKLAT